MKCQCNKSSIMISAELHRSGLSASDDVLVFSSDYDEITFYFLSDKKDIQKETFPLKAITVDNKQPMRLYYAEREFWLEVPLRFIHKGEISKININLSSLKCYFIVS